MRLALAAVPLLLASTATQAAVIDFEADSGGVKPNGFVSASSPLASFSVSGSGVQHISNNATPTIGNALIMASSATGRQQIDFSVPIDSLSMVFANDDACCATLPAFAWLQVFDGATLVDTVSVQMNMNDLPDQTISYVGSPFNRAQIWYGTSQGVGSSLSVVIDNVTFNVAETPEPASLALLGAGLLGLAGLRRRR